MNANVIMMIAKMTKVTKVANTAKKGKHAKIMKAGRAGPFHIRKDKFMHYLMASAKLAKVIEMTIFWAVRVGRCEVSRRILLESGEDEDGERRE